MNRPTDRNRCFKSLETDEELRKRVCHSWCNRFDGDALDGHAWYFHDAQRKIVERMT